MVSAGRRCIQNNYSRIKDVERELSGLQMQLKLSTGPKRSALMMLRKKIELQNERVLAARERQKAAKKVIHMPAICSALKLHQHIHTLTGQRQCSPRDVWEWHLSPLQSAAAPLHLHQQPRLHLHLHWSLGE